MTTDPAATLRAASVRLREVAGAATWEFRYFESTGWTPVDSVKFMDADCERFITFDAPSEAQAIADLYMTMSPPVAHALADWLDDMLDRVDNAFDPGVFVQLDGGARSALAVARAILGSDA